MNAIVTVTDVINPSVIYNRVAPMLNLFGSDKVHASKPVIFVSSVLLYSVVISGSLCPVVKHHVYKVIKHLTIIIFSPKM